MPPAAEILQAILFSPRGGSAHLTRSLTRELRRQGRPLTLVAGSRSDLGSLGDARDFYGGEVHAVDFSPALVSGDPLAYEGPPGTAPIHPSFEDRPGAPDAVFARLGEAAYERQVAAWSRELARAGAGRAAVLHLHHLTPLNEAARRVAPGVPVLGQLHGTELLMLEEIEAGPPEGWTHAAQWRERLRDWAAGCRRLLVAPGGADRALDLLGLEPSRLVELGGGFDEETFRPAELDRLAFWREVFGNERALRAAGAEGPPPAPAAIDRLTEGCVFVYAGRFTRVKRLDRLIRAFGELAGGEPGADGEGTPSLVLVGGHPGELEGEHPVRLAERLGIPGVFHAGWRPHAELARFFAASDAVVLASEREQFGQVLVEGMACGIPAISTRSSGPEAIVADGSTGWLAERSSDDLARVLAEALRHPEERRRRGLAARDSVLHRFSWSAVAASVGEVLGGVAGEGPGSGRAALPLSA